MAHIPPPRWRKSSYSGVTTENCVEIAALDATTIGVRDSKAPQAGTLNLSPAAWRRLTEEIRADRYAV